MAATEQQTTHSSAAVRSTNIDRLSAAAAHRPRDADVLDHIQRYTQSYFHPVGTCAIGSVVESELRVLGVDGLRVVDASVMPVNPRGTPTRRQS